MNFKNSDMKRIKGFTLVELIIVIAIITILSGIISVSVYGMQRDSRIEAQNHNAQMVYAAFQDILIDCEIKQDKSLFDAYDYQGAYGDIIGVWVFFRISKTDFNGNKMDNPGTGLGDEIHINTMYTQNAFHGMGGGPLTGLSVWSPSTTQNVSGNPGHNDYDYPRYGPDGGEHLWKKINAAVTGRIDPSMEGSYCVMMDLQEYEVKSVICRDLINGKDPKTGLWDDNEVNGTGGIVLGDYAIKADYLKPIDGTMYHLPLGVAFFKNRAVENKISKDKGVYVGCYPFYDDLYDGYA